MSTVSILNRKNNFVNSKSHFGTEKLQVWIDHFCVFLPWVTVTITSIIFLLCLHQDEVSQAASHPSEDSGLAASPTFSVSQELQPQIHHQQQNNHHPQQQQELQQQNNHGQYTKSVEKNSEVKKTETLMHVKSQQEASTDLIAVTDSEGSLTTSREHSNLVAMATKAALASAQDQNMLTTMKYQNVRDTNIIATNETTVTKVTTTVNKTMETHLATETNGTKTSHVQDVHYGRTQSNNIVETAGENNGGHFNNKNDAVNIQDVQSSTTGEVPTKMVQENMATKGTPMGSQEEMEKASSTQETYLQTVKSDVINVDVVNINRKDVIVENDVNVQAISDNTVTTAGPSVTSISSNLVAEFMGRDDVDGQTYQSISGNQTDRIGTLERGAGDGNDTLNSANVPMMRLPLDSSTPYRVYQVGHGSGCYLLLCSHAPSR